MNELHLTRIIADQPLTCFQCLNLGLPLDGIAKGDTCIEIQAPNGRIDFACEDCYGRLSVEIGAIVEEEADTEIGETPDDATDEKEG